jgi:hypothetical protein
MKLRAASRTGDVAYFVVYLATAIFFPVGMLVAS